MLDHIDHPDISAITRYRLSVINARPCCLFHAMPTAQTVATAVVGVAAAGLAVHAVARKRELGRLAVEAARQEEREKERARRVQESRDRADDRERAGGTKKKKQGAGADVRSLNQFIRDTQIARVERCGIRCPKTRKAHC